MDQETMKRAVGNIGGAFQIGDLLAPLPAESGAGLVVRFEYANPARFFHWSGDLVAGHALFEADFGAGRTTLSAAASLLSPETALSEAMFF